MSRHEDVVKQTHASSAEARPAGPAIRLTVITAHELVAAGVAALLAPFPDRVQVTTLGEAQQCGPDPDLVLFANLGSRRAARSAGGPGRLRGSRTLMATWAPQGDRRHPPPEISGEISLMSSGLELLDALERVASTWHGPPSVARAAIVAVTDASDWPGRTAGLTQRESQVIGLVASGLSNQEVAEHLYLSINTVKTYIRLAYRKMSVQTRSQAVLWAIEHGFASRRAVTDRGSP